jgi:hypothetical protein
MPHPSHGRYPADPREPIIPADGLPESIDSGSLSIFEKIDV